VKKCKYCGKVTQFKNNNQESVCENEYVCEDTVAPTFEQEHGQDPTGRGWEPW